MYFDPSVEFRSLYGGPHQSLRQKHLKLTLFVRHSIPFVSVDEVKKALFNKAQLKSFDFVVYSKKGPNLLIDVKGRSHRLKSLGQKTKATYDA